MNVELLMKIVNSFELNITATSESSILNIWGGPEFTSGLGYFLTTVVKTESLKDTLAFCIYPNFQSYVQNNQAISINFNEHVLMWMILIWGHDLEVLWRFSNVYAALFQLFIFLVK